jgi:hypothetical protein
MPPPCIRERLIERSRSLCRSTVPGETTLLLDEPTLPVVPADASPG